MSEMPQSPFADIAVALSLASSKVQRDLAHTRVIAERIGLSEMGLELVLAGLERDAALVSDAVELFKQMSEAEPEIRAVLTRKQRSSWLSSLKVAVL